jgi:hypothetical protein
MKLILNVFGTTVISFLILVGLNATVEQCFTYAIPLGFLLTIILRIVKVVRK